MNSTNITTISPNCDLNQLLLTYHQTCAEIPTIPTFTDFSSCPVVPDFFPPAEEHTGDSKQTGKRLLHGLSATFFVTICTIFGAFILPCFQNREEIFGQIMLFLTALAVSALSGAALMVLIPEGLGLQDCGQFAESHLTVCMGILMFFVIRRALHLLTGHEDIFTTDLIQGDAPKSRTATVINDKEQGEILLDCGECDSRGHCTDKGNSSSISPTNSGSQTGSQCALRKRKAIEGIKAMKSVGWMTLLGDSAHNFLDGIALGATFHHSGDPAKAIANGWQITIAVLAEEFPHELGDFAVLLRAGLTVSEAILCNLVSGGTCLLGYFVGMKYGENFGLSVFSWMGGVFLFISLACMLPEVETTITDLNAKFNREKNIWKLLRFKIIAILGFISGYAIVYCSGKYVSFE